MLLWRLSGEQHARSFDGGYGLVFDGRWNTVGHAVTYCATSPSLCVLEKLVHVEDPTLLPKLVMVTYDMPDSLVMDVVAFDQLPADWRRQETWSQQYGDDWHRARKTPMLMVPSAIVPLAHSPDRNVVLNHDHPDIAEIRMQSLEPFVLDPRLL
jgi:RES domain-containing protein